MATTVPAPADVALRPERTRLPVDRRPAAPVVDLRTAEDRRARRRFGALIALVVVLAAALRAVALPAALPYASYVDEGHVLQRSDHIVAGPTWEPGWYRYPSLVPGAVGALTGVASIADAELRRDSEAADRSPYYDIVSPGALLLGRLLVWGSSVGTVIVVALLATRLGGRVVGFVATVLVAALPALVARSAIVIVDTPATFFVTAALLAATELAHGRRAWVAALLGGACCGLALTAKYTAAAIVVAVLVAIALAPHQRLRRRVGLAAVACVTTVVTAVLAMPALVLRFEAVRWDVERQAEIYARRSTTVSYGAAITSVDEVGWVLLVLGAVGLVLMLRRRRARIVAVGWSLFTGMSVAIALRSAYQPLRNALPLLPFVAVAAAFAVVGGCRWVGERAGRRPGGASLRTRRIASVAVTVALAAVMLGVGLGPTYLASGSVIDSRSVAVDWLAEHVEAGSRVVVAEELAIPPWELARIPGTVAVVPTVGPGAAGGFGSYDVVVLGRWRTDEALTSEAAGGVVLASFGRKQGVPDQGGWRGNNQRIDVVAPRVR